MTQAFFLKFSAALPFLPVVRHPTQGALHGPDSPFVSEAAIQFQAFGEESLRPLVVVLIIRKITSPIE
jgi:hypothetical protein